MFCSSEGKKVHNTSGNLMYSLVTIVNNDPVLYTLKLMLIILIISSSKTAHIRQVEKYINYLHSVHIYISKQHVVHFKCVQFLSIGQ